MTAPALFRPPAPTPRSPLVSLVRTVLRPERDLLSILPVDAYRELVTTLGYSRRTILLVNAPDEVARILADPDRLFPKNDLMVGALLPLVGNSIFTSNGELWHRQRAMIDPAFSHMRINRAFPAMAGAVDDYEATLEELAATGGPFSLDGAMSHLTSDIITRTIFSRSLASGPARAVFDAFTVWQRSVANVELRRLIFDPPFKVVAQPPHVVAACRRIREHIGTLVDERLAPGAPREDDIAGAAIAARDATTGEGFTREELVDEIGLFFLAGQETTASALTWAFYLISRHRETLERMRAEIEQVVGSGPVEFEHVKRLAFVRNVFRETMRLYPPITFIPRVAAEATTIAGRRVRRGTMVMVSPWTLHRHFKLWESPDRFDPDRFSADRERAITPGTYLPFGGGPRICVGAAFATIESTLILARVVRRFDLEVLDPGGVDPVSRLTTRPMREIQCRVQRRT